MQIQVQGDTVYKIERHYIGTESVEEIIRQKIIAQSDGVIFAKASPDKYNDES